MWLGPFHNPTQLTGFVFFAGAASAAALAARRSPAGPSRRHWAWLAAIHLALVAEVMLDLRYASHDAIDALLQAFDTYGSRRSIQVGLLAMVAILAGVLVVYRWFARYESTCARIAEFATFAAVLDFAVETVSLHQIDSVLYRSVGPVLLNGWLWAAAALVVIVSALTEGQRRVGA